jgi:uncharacterized membrane protein YeaQ/YmgE (transglycosylase-associated protein family)
MQLISMAIVGLIVGLLARYFYLGPVRVGLIGTMLLGIAGSYLAGFLGNLIQRRRVDQPLQPAGCLFSVVGAMLVIYIARHVFHLL